MAKEIYDVAIIGRGVVGLSAAIYCGRLNLKTVIIGVAGGGTIAKTDVIENYPGFESISGMELSEKILKHAKNYDVKIVSDIVNEVSGGKTCFVLKTRKKDYHAKTIIFATGSELKKLKVAGEEKFMNKGVHSCALCDGGFYKNKIVAVIGGRDSAVKEALLLSDYAKKVYMIARSTLKPEPINMQRLKKEKKIEVIEGNQIKEIKGNEFVNSIVLKNKLKSGSNILKLDGIFVNIGHIPLSHLAVKLGVKVNKNNEIIIDKDSQTNIKGVYAAGDVADSRFKQAITGVGEGIKAVYSIYEYLKHENIAGNFSY